MKKIALIIVAALGVSACATVNPTYRLGARAEMSKSFDEAIRYYEQASLEDPKETFYRAALERAKISASLFELQEARKLIALGKKNEAKAVYAKALAYNPRDSAIAREAQLATSDAPKPAEAKPEKIEFPIKLKTKDEALQLKFPVETSLRSIFLALGKAAGLSFVFDENFRDIPFMTDLSNMPPEQAIRSICLATRNFYRIVDERTILIIPDNPMKRIQYEVNCIKTFYLSNVGAQEMQAALSSMLRSTAKVPNIIFDKNLNSITVRDTPQVVELSEKLIKIWDKPKAQVIVDLEIMEVSRIKERQLGLSFGTGEVGAQYVGSTTAGDTSSSNSTSWFNLKGIDFGNAANFALSLPSALVKLLEADADTKIIAQPRLPGVSDEEMRHLVGQKIPIPQTSFYSIAAGGVSQQPVTSFTQQDVGIEIKIKPTVHRENEVTLAMEVKVTSLGGTGYADIPIINTREIKNTIRLRDGETSLLAGLLKDEERKSVKGVPGLKNIPVLGRLFSSEETTIEQSDVIMTITPYIIRTIPVVPEEAKPLWVDVDTASESLGGALEADVLDRELNTQQAERMLQARRQQDLRTSQISLSPSNFETQMGRPVRLSVNLTTGQEISNISLVLNFNAQVLSLKDVQEGGLTRQVSGGGGVPFLKSIDDAAGLCTIGFSSPQPSKGLSGGGTLATLVFEPKGSGEAFITVSSVSAMGPSGQPVNLQTSRARVMVR
jgi:general secretion pathway protein D